MFRPSSSKIKPYYLLIALAATSCDSQSSETSAANLQTSEWHLRHANCAGDFLAIRDGSLIYAKGETRAALLRNITLEAAGSQRFQMISTIGKFRLVTVIETDESRKTLTFSQISIDPLPQDGDWKVMESQGYSKAKFEAQQLQLPKLGPFEVCPPSGGAK